MEDKALTEQMASQIDEARCFRQTITDCKACEAIIRKDEADKMIREGFKSPEEVASIIRAATDAFNWNTADIVVDIVVKARQDALKEVVARFDKQQVDWMTQSWIDAGIEPGEHKYVPSVIDVIEQLRSESGRMPEEK